MCPPLVRGISSPAKENRGVSPKLWKEKEPQAHGVRTIGRTTLPTASGITPRSLSSGKSPQSEGERTAQGGGFAERAGIRHLIGTKPRQGCRPTDQIPPDSHIAVSSLYARRPSTSRQRPTKGPAKSERIHPPVPSARLPTAVLSPYAKNRGMSSFLKYFASSSAGGFIVRSWFIGICLIACVAGADDHAGRETLNATLWMQRAPEYRAGAEQVYRLAAQK